MHNEPLAIVGVGCRFAGAVDSPQALWSLLCGQEVAFVDVPPHRWSLALHHDPDPEVPGKSYVRQGGFINQRIEYFDAGFFGILPKEAESLDPQQRLLLECSWEALEDAGIPGGSLAGSKTGVYVGVFTLDGMMTQVSPMSRHLISQNTATSISATIVSNRLSYFYDLRGPSFSTDTACSSSLVAFHYACQDLWAGRTTMAMVGGTSVMMRPEYPIAMAKGGFLSPDARCKPFDSRANGYARGEGAGLVVIKPLSAALADNNPIYSLVVGTGVNQDGHTMGITVPNFNSQKALIEEVYSRYGLNPAETTYAEAHGTGTPVGDPIEAQAIGEAIGQAGAAKGRKQPLIMGSLKANIGHTEAVAGVAGVIKAALCLSHGQVPPQANLLEANPQIPFADLNLTLPRKIETLPQGGKPNQASINSFGFGGTNAHAVLRQPPQAEAVSPDCAPEDRPFLTPLSAQSGPALAAFAGACAAQLSDPEQSLDGLRRSLAFRRTHHAQRLAVVAKDREDLISKLQAVAGGATAGVGIVQGRTQRGDVGAPVFVFTGMGPQWWGMGRDLMEREPVFRAKALEIDAIFQEFAGWSILEEMGRSEETSQISSNQYAQPANFVIQVALAELLASWGIKPSAIVGHSVGEVSAAHIAGALSLRDATLVSYHRSQAQQRAAGKGQMLALGMSAEAAKPLLDARKGRVEVAAVNSPGAVTLAGDPDAIAEIAQEVGGTAFNRVLTVEVAYHSHHMEPLKDEILTSLAGLQPMAPTVPIYSTVTGARVETACHDALYWWHNVRQPVLFAKAAQTMLVDGYSLFMEVGPHPVLKSSLSGVMAENGVQGVTLKTLMRGKPEQQMLMESIGELYCQGMALDWERFVPQGTGFVRFPRYPWQREFYWIEGEEARADRLGFEGHQLLGRRQLLPTPSWQTEVNRGFMPWIDDHVIDGAKILPGAAYVEAALEAGRQLSGQRAGSVENVRLIKALAVPPRSAVQMRLSVEPQSNRFVIHSRLIREGAEWTEHAEGLLAPATPSALNAPLEIAALRTRLGDAEEGSDFYRRLDERGLSYGPQFQCVRRLWAKGSEVLARLEVSPTADPAAAGYGMHPALLDSAFQMMIGALDGEGAAGGAYIPVHLGRVSMSADLGRAVWAYGRVTQVTGSFVEGDIILTDDGGVVIAQVDGLRCQSVGDDGAAVRQHMENWLYEYVWEQASEELTNTVKGSSWDVYAAWLVLADRGGLGEGLAKTLIERNQPCILAYADGKAEDSTAFCDADGVYHLAPESKAAMIDLLTQAREQGIGRVLYAWGCDDDQTNDWEGTTRCVGLMHLMQSMQDAQILPRLSVITAGSQAVQSSDLPAPAQAAVWGLARVILNEIPEVQVRSLDLPPALQVDEDVLSLAADLLVAETEEDELSLRDGAIWIHRLNRLPIPDENANLEAIAAATGEFALAAAGHRHGLQWRSQAQKNPQAEQLKVRLQRVVLDDADWRALQGTSGKSDGHGATFAGLFGAFAAGTVEQAGQKADASLVGNVVIPLVAPSALHAVTDGLPGVMRSHLLVQADRVVAVPAVLGDQNYRLALAPQAVMIAMADLLVQDMARVDRDDMVLLPVTGALWDRALVQAVMRRGATAIVASENADVAAQMRGLGAELVLCCPQSELEQRVQTLTGNNGVSVVITSAVGAGLVQALKSVAPFGRAVRVTTRSGSQSDMIPAHLLASNISLSTFDAGAVLEKQPARLTDMLTALWPLFETGALTVADVQTCSVEALGALITSEDDAVPPEVVALDQGMLTCLPGHDIGRPFRQDGTYLVTGGFGGFGAEIARWLADNGAGCVALVGRKGAATEGADALMRDIMRRGAKVVAKACDVANEEAVSTMLAELRAAQDDGVPPLRGIVHAATVFDDRFVLGMDVQGYRAVMGAKARGALILDMLSQPDPIELFLSCSSVSALIGKPGQCNYVSANAVLDTLSWRRRAQGQSALSVNWGVIGGVGVAARDDELREHLARQGIRPMPYRQVLELVPHLMRMGVTQTGVMDVDWEANLGFLPSPRLSNLMGGGSEVITPYVEMLLGMPDAARIGKVQELLIKEVSDALRLPAEKIEPGVPLNALGVDSLTAVELQTAIRVAFGVNLSQLEIVTGDGVSHIAQIIMDRLGLKSAVATASSAEAKAVPA